MVIVLEENQLEKLVAPCNMIAFEDEIQIFWNFFKVTCYGVQLVSNHLVIYTSLTPFQYIFRDLLFKIHLFN